MTVKLYHQTNQIFDMEMQVVVILQLFSGVAPSSKEILSASVGCMMFWLHWVITFAIVLNLNIQMSKEDVLLIIY